MRNTDYFLSREFGSPFFWSSKSYYHKRCTQIWGHLLYKISFINYGWQVFGDHQIVFHLTQWQEGFALHLCSNCRSYPPQTVREEQWYCFGAAPTQTPCNWWVGFLCPGCSVVQQLESEVQDCVGIILFSLSIFPVFKLSHLYRQTHGFVSR